MSMGTDRPPNPPQPSHLANWDDDLGPPEYPDLVPASPRRETITARLACLAAAAGLGASKLTSSAAEVLTVAAEFEQWVNRSEG